MEFLKKGNIVIIFFLVISINLQAQADKIAAFKSSYVLESKGQYKKAVDVVKGVYSENSYEINMRLAWLSYQSGLFTQSAAYYQKAIKLMPYSEEAKFGLIYPKAALAKWKEIETIYLSILKISPNNTIANYRLGLIYYGRKNYVAAYKLFKKVVDLYPFKYDALLMYAWTNLQLGKSSAAKILFNKVLLLSPSDKSANEGLKLIK